MPSAIVETPSKGDAINAPLDADLRNAASVRVPFQATGNRLKFLENFYDAIKAWKLGGTITPAALLTIAQQVVFGTTTQFIDTAFFAGGIEVDDGGDFTGPLSFSGGGRIQYPGVVVPDSNTSVDVALQKFIYVDLANGAHTITLTGTLADGDWFVVNNRSGQPQTLAGLVTATIAAATPGGSHGTMFLKIGGAFKAAMQWDA
jgi:hypothetical protein